MIRKRPEFYHYGRISIKQSHIRELQWLGEPRWHLLENPTAKWIDTLSQRTKTINRCIEAWCIFASFYQGNGSEWTRWLAVQVGDVKTGKMLLHPQWWQQKCSRIRPVRWRLAKWAMYCGLILSALC